MRRLRASNPLVIRAAQERARILTNLGRPVDAKTARIAVLGPTESNRAEPHESKDADIAENDLLLMSDALRHAARQAAREGLDMSDPIKVEIGDIVIYSKYGGTEIKMGSHEYLVLSANDVMAISKDPGSPIADASGPAIVAMKQT